MERALDKNRKKKSNKICSKRTKNGGGGCLENFIGYLQNTMNEELLYPVLRTVVVSIWESG
jgi:hypothetical protein